MKKLFFIVALTVLYGCMKETEEKRIVLKTLENNKFNVTLYKISRLSDVTTYVSVSNGRKETTVFHGNFGSVVDIYFKGSDTLYLKCYKPSSNIIYKYKNNINGLSVLKDTIITEDEYYLMTRNK